MRNRNFVVLCVLVVLLGISTGFIVINPEQLGFFASTVVGLFFTYWMGGPGGNAGAGNGENSIP